MSHRVLVVDDNEDVRHILSLRLRNAGFEVGAVADGAEALEALKREKWDVVLLDLMMPRMDGFKLLDALKARRGAAPRVVVITQYDEPENRARAMALGAAHYLPKADAFERQFVCTLKKWLPAEKSCRR